jgi:hypothetical protein
MPSLAEKALQFSNHLPEFANMHGGRQSEQNKVPKGFKYIQIHICTSIRFV